MPSISYCPVCGSIDIIAGRCPHCGSPAEKTNEEILNYEKRKDVRIRQHAYH